MNHETTSRRYNVITCNAIIVNLYGISILKSGRFLFLVPKLFNAISTQWIGLSIGHLLTGEIALI